MKFKQVSVVEAKSLLENGASMVDVRSEASFNEAHIPTATHLSMATIDAFCITRNKAAPLIVYCYHGISSLSVAQHLAEQGFTHVYSLVGGFEAWKND